jgi:hypothetical protein
MLMASSSDKEKFSVLFDCTTKIALGKETSCLKVK